jgi:ribosomal-protein-alanine N-acetyltransferase
VSATPFTDPWSEASFPGNALPGTIALISGWTAWSLASWRGKSSAPPALKPRGNAGRRRRGIGQALLEAGLAAVRSRGGREVFLEVRASNAAAQALYLGHGFRPAGRRRGYYQRPSEDALVLHLALPGASG